MNIEENNHESSKTLELAIQKMKKVAVYKTTVEDRTKAQSIVETIRRQLPGCEASFDLEDCDKVLRVVNVTDGISEAKIRDILQYYGHNMETLP